MLNRYQKTIFTPTSISENPKPLDWFIAIFLVIVQQDAFITVTHLLLYPGEGEDGAENIFNTLSNIICIILLFIGSIPVLPLLKRLAFRNIYSILYITVVLSSIIWSLHPDLSLRRGCAYVLTIGIAGYIAVRFTPEQALLVLARSFAIGGVCSVAFVLLFPEIGIMSGGELEGNWRGVYPHKNPFGFAMAIALFVQIQLIASAKQRSISAYAWACFYIVLVFLSKSTTALTTSILYVFAGINYVLWKNNRIYGYNLLLITSLAVAVLLPASFLAPDLFLGVIGKDSTLTGRTDVWDAVVELISQKPVLGWGYRAMWIPADPISVWVDSRAGWRVPSAHNSFLEFTLEIGLIGLASLILIICQAFWRAIRCCALGLLPFGLFSLVFFIGTIVAGQTVETLGVNQDIDWLVFNILSFLAGERLAAIYSTDGDRSVN